RIIAATNQNLQDRVKRGEYRQDLYYRLKVVEIRVPSLRGRTEDIPLLIHHFLKTFNHQFDKEIEGISPAALRLMVTCPWPGNVRELRNMLEYICILCKSRIITKDDLPADFPGGPDDRLLPFPPDTDPPPLPSRPLQTNRQTLLKVLEQEQWNKTRAAEVLGISRRTLYRRLKEYQI
ncbi:MAG: sigma-54-dependent Fis family transcriptional regulator, partial [Deltaproteobacteria bacterium]|nr:sigma-54-dependent Fis family transcriptional regulator [Deltaproteobacteria bacterium]